MDKKSATSFLIAELQKHPAHLWLGQEPVIVQQLQKCFQDYSCPKNGCSACSVCNQIVLKQHQSFLWLTPEKYYTLEHIEIIAKNATLKLEENNHFFFIIEKAEALTIACVNRLLKLIEEPPEGYHFILLAYQADTLADTLKSRCFIRYWHEHDIALDQTHPLLSFFFNTTLPDASTFLSALDKEEMHERLVIEYVDKALAYWTTIYKKSIQESNPYKSLYALEKIELFNTSAKTPPMSGSTKHFLKNIYLQLLEKCSERRKI